MAASNDHIYHIILFFLYALVILDSQELTDRLSYWQELLVVDDDSDTTDDDTIKMEAFEACGGICPYLDDTYSRSIEQVCN